MSRLQRKIENRSFQLKPNSTLLDMETFRLWTQAEVLKFRWWKNYKY